jgi:iron complex outermembrane receptor protein
VAGTVHFSTHFSLYDALSFNQSIYEDNYVTGAANTVVPTAGTSAPDSPKWLNKVVASANFGPLEGQLTGDFVGKRFATYTNDLSVKSYFLMGLQVAY